MSVNSRNHCPYCGSEISFTQKIVSMGSVKTSPCPKCGRKMKLKLAWTPRVLSYLLAAVLMGTLGLLHFGILAVLVFFVVLILPCWFDEIIPGEREG